MHKLGLGVMTAAAAFSIAAFAQSSNSPSQFCKANGDFGGPHDICVACAAAIMELEPPSAICQCKTFQYVDEYDFDVQFGNLGQCVSFVNHGGSIL